ncbi:hypothetical protein AB4Y43_16720 [Paraburkholderia sp. BR10872]|uniref:hypothetical protein n=1 Tax=Paraburkholderia sp. BR10872 TaxID=3236989 RepID=UPI0034D28977
MSFIQGRAIRNQAAAENWMSYARELEQKLANAQAGLEAMRTLKDAAITELGKVDPANYLMNQANRQKILDTAYSQKQS